MTSINFDKVPCSKIEVQAAATRALLLKLPAGDYDIWCDGSVGAYEGEETDWERRVAVQWNDGWFAGTAHYLSNTENGHPCIQVYKEKQTKDPHLWIQYDDGYIMAYGEEEPNMVRDSDGQLLHIVKMPASKVGAGAFEVWHRDGKETEHGIVPAGINICSYTAEVRAMLAALQKVKNE